MKGKPRKKAKNEVIRETKTLFCPECNSLLVLNKESGLRQCMVCKKKWRYVGGKSCVVTERKVRKGGRMIDDT